MSSHDKERISHDTATRADQETVGVVPDPAEGQQFGRYRIEGLIGAGGMGRVYRAYDVTLARHVALKCLRHDDPALIGQLLREARAQARVDHEHVCKVFEVATLDGRPYIAMQYVAGLPLDAAAPGMTLPQKVTVMRAVADAVHAAHRTGLIHRDLKPRNIIVQRTAEGAWTPYVVDFGLARNPEAAGITMPGQWVGTPAYMAPEQARGDWQRLDRRTDVYSLGATLYELLSGRPPFRGASGADVIVKVLRDDPAGLRALDPAIPAELATIAAKCLEKDPDQRYESARALAEDLARFLDGDPILAQPASWLYRASKRARKHKTATAVAGVAAVALIAVGSAGLRERWVAAERASVAERLGREVERIQALMRHAHMLPLHDIRPEHALVKAQIDRLRSLMAEAGPPGVGPGHYAIGRGYLALDEHGAAREHLQQAWQAGYRTPDTAYALGLALGALYQRAIEEARRLRDPELRRAATSDAERNLREPALSYLKEARGAEIDAPAYVEGLIDFYEQRYEAARQKAREALDRRPWLYEARRLDGDALVVSGRAKQERGDHAGAMLDLEQAAAAYGAALDVARSDPGLYEAECVRRTHVMEIEILRGLSPQDAFQQALAACDAALGVHPALGRVHTRKARIQWLWSDWQVARGQDPGPALEEALRAAERAVEADPRDAAAHIVRGTAHRLAAEYGFRRGVDPRGSLDRAIESFERATAIDQGLASAYDQIGTAYDIKAEYVLARGGDPRPEIDRAIAAYQEAIRLRPDYAGAHHNLGYAFRLRGEYELAHGLEPASLERAAASFERAIEINPGLVASYAFLGLICAHQAQALSARGADPTHVLERGRAAIQKGRAVNPKYVWLSVDEALIEIAAARWALRQGSSPEAPLDRAEAAARDLLARNLHVDEVAKTRAQVYRWRAEWRVRQGRDPARDIAEGLAAIDQALKLSPRMSEALALQGTFRVLEARVTRDASQRQEALRQARDLLERAFASNPLLRREYEPVVADAAAFESGAGQKPRR